MAINGDGFFVVEKPSSFTDNRPMFDGIDLYTRRGDFQPDKNGYLVNGAGYYLMGIPVDPTTGNLVGSVPQLLQFQNDFLPAQATTAIDYRANLASYPLTSKHDTNVPKSELLNPLDFSANPLAGSPAPASINGQNANILSGRAGGDDRHGRSVDAQLRRRKPGVDRRRHGDGHDRGERRQERDHRQDQRQCRAVGHRDHGDARFAKSHRADQRRMPTRRSPSASPARGTLLSRTRLVGRHRQPDQSADPAHGRPGRDPDRCGRPARRPGHHHDHQVRRRCRRSLDPGRAELHAGRPAENHRRHRLGRCPTATSPSRRSVRPTTLRSAAPW